MASTESVFASLDALSPSVVLRAESVEKAFGPVAVIGGLSLTARAGEFVCVVGPSGCGKTTLLMTLAGLMSADKGRIEVEGRAIDGPPPAVAVVFQDYSRSLMPWLRNVDNVAFGMRRLAGYSKAAKREEAATILAEVGLRGFERHYPWQVSGGMQQRVAIARALASKAPLLLLDEPLAAVDAQTRGDLQDLLLGLSQRFERTCLLVTHDVDEAVYMADRIVVLSQRPTRVVREIPVALSKPRDQIATKATPEFLALRAEVMGMIRSMPKPM
jgi:NitT/TauT family transport system ATP-binding protein